MRAFIVGNGPSLKDTPLNLLKNEACFATNRIHLIYNKTEWRPNYYIRAESHEDTSSDHWKDEVLLHLNDPDIECWLNPWFYKKLGVEQDKVIDGCSHYLNDYDDEYAPSLWHLPKLCTFGSSLHVAIQIAIQKGFGPIYLVGCDLGFEHFDSQYTKGYNRKDARVNHMNLIAGHIQALKSSSVPIYNATIGGQLEVYERVDIETLVSR